MPSFFKFFITAMGLSLLLTGMGGVYVYGNIQTEGTYVSSLSQVNEDGTVTEAIIFKLETGRSVIVVPTYTELSNCKNSQKCTVSLSNHDIYPNKLGYNIPCIAFGWLHILLIIYFVSISKGE